jgi:hypothetical protein
MNENYDQCMNPVLYCHEYGVSEQFDHCVGRNIVREGIQMKLDEGWVWKNLEAEHVKVVSFRQVSRILPQCLMLHGHRASLRLHLRRVLCSNTASSRCSALQFRLLGLPLQFSL